MSEDKDYLLLVLSLVFLTVTAGVYSISLFYTLLPCFLILHFYKKDLSILEKFLFSVPLSAVMIYWPYFVLTRGFQIVLKSYFLFEPALLSGIILLLNLEQVKKFKFKLPSINVKPSFLLITALFFAGFFAVHFPFLTANANPMTLGAKWVYETHELVLSVLNGEFIGWSTKWYSGMTTFYSYPPLSYLIPAAQSAVTALTAWKNLNVSLYVFSLLFGLSLYAFLKNFKISEEISLTLALVGVVLPITVKVSEVTKTIMDQFFICLFLLVLLRFFKKPRKNAFLLSITLFAWFMNYYFNVYVLVFPLLISIFLFFKTFEDKKGVLFWGALSAGIAILLSMAWMLPFFSWLDYFPFKYQEGAWMSIMDSPTKFFEIAASHLDPSKVEYDIPSLTGLSPQFFYLGLASVIILFLVSKKKLSEQNFPGILSIILLAYIFLQFTPFWKFIPKYDILFGRVYQYYLFIPLFAFSIGRLVQDYWESQGALKQAIFITLFLILFSNVFMFSYNLSRSFIAESAMTDRTEFELLYNTLDQYPEGRFVVFGIFGPGIIPGITFWTGKPAFAGYGFESHCTLRVYENTILPVQQASNDFLKPNNGHLAYNLFKKAGVDIVISNVCSPIGLASYKVFYSDYVRQGNETCAKVFHMNETYLVEKPYLTKVFSPTIDGESLREATIEGVLQRKGGYKFDFLVNDSLPLEDYAFALSDGVVDMDLMGFNGTLLFTGLEEDFEGVDYADKIYLGTGVENFEDVNATPREMFFQEKNDLFVVRNVKPGDLVLFKQAFFPKWRAYQSGKELPILETYQGYMLVKARTIGVITFTVETHFVEFLGALLSLLGFAGVLLLAKNSF